MKSQKDILKSIEGLSDIMENGKLILDACCGSRMFWFDKHNPLALFVDKRSEIVTAKDRDKIRTIEIKPDIKPISPTCRLRTILSTWWYSTHRT